VRCCGVRATVVVLADRIGCRSRRTAPGPSRPSVKSAWITTKGLACSRESVAGERAPEAGSSAAKRRYRWRVSNHFGNGAVRKRTPGDMRRWKAFRVGKAALVDEGAAGTILGSSEFFGSAGDPRGATGDVRGNSLSCIREENARVWWGPRKKTGTPDALSSERKSATNHCERSRRSWSQAPSSADQPGPDCRKVVRRRTGEPWPQSQWEVPCGPRGASRVPGSRAIHGCSCRVSVAEVGQKHLRRISEGSREASRAEAA
jgi:hypothetical protein